MPATKCASRKKYSSCRKIKSASTGKSRCKWSKTAQVCKPKKKKAASGGKKVSKWQALVKRVMKRDGVALGVAAKRAKKEYKA
jgi:hypothetical protein